MGFLDGILGKTVRHDDWTVTHQAQLRELTYDEIVEALGRPQKAKGGFVYWRGPLSDIDPDYPDDEYYQLSNKDFRGFGDAAKSPKLDREYWFVLATSERTIRTLARDVGGIPRNVESV